MITWYVLRLRFSEIHDKPWPKKRVWARAKLPQDVNHSLGKWSICTEFIDLETIRGCFLSPEAPELNVGDQFTLFFDLPVVASATVTAIEYSDAPVGLSREAQKRLAEICRDHGTMTTAQRIEFLIEAYEDIRKELRDALVETVDLRVRMSRLKNRVAHLKVDESMVPDWVKEKLADTQWDIIAYKDGGRNVIGVSRHFVHSRSKKDFENEDRCWQEVLDSAFYFALKDLKDAK